MISKFRDLGVIAGRPGLRSMVHRARSVGLLTLLDYQRLALFAAAIRYALPLGGDFIEFGTYKGGSAAIAAQLLVKSGKMVYLCDSFEGLPAPGEKDNYHCEGGFEDTSAAAVRRGFELLGVRAEIYEGWFSETLQRLQHLRLSVAHVDVDLYGSARECLQFCYPRMIRGGVIIIDDYGDPRCLGVKAACDEFFQGTREKLVRLSCPSVGVLIGSNDESLFDILRRHAGWTSLVPLLGRGLYRR